MYGLLRVCLRHRKRLLGATLGAVVLFNAVELALPKLLQIYVDAMGHKPLRLAGRSLDFLATPTGRIALIPGALIVFALLRWAVTYARSVLETRLGENVLYDLRNRIFNTMQSLSFAYHDKTHSGTLVSNVVEDVNYASRYFRFGFTHMLESTIYIVLASAYIWVILPSAGLWSSGLLALSPSYTSGQCTGADLCRG
jgi:ABC-type multidrug transport system fused ATPase/permease subunit